MLLFLCILFLYKFALTKQTANITINSDLSNQINLDKNIVQFNLSNRSLIPTNSNNASNETKHVVFDDFKPSIQFNAGIDYGNQEARSKNWAWQQNTNTNNQEYPHRQENQNRQEYPNRQENPNKQEYPNWQENPNKQEETALEAPWKSTKIKFPTPSVERPYPFESNYENPPYVELPYNHYPNRPNKPPQESLWKKVFGFTGLENKLPVSSQQKSFYGHNVEEHPHYSYHEPPREFHHSMESYGSGISPIKKILKILATIIPIGLFISALTPTIITVTSVNNTLTRNNRKSDTQNIMEKIKTSLDTLEKLQQDGCEQKVFCELMVNAMFSKNAEEHIKNLLNNFVKKEGVKDEINFIKVLEAVKNEDCSLLICNSKNS